ncbi:unnamed protein product [Rodentolepis nana]|uniref:peptide-methionine (S)-S-oxide reductase n=1 Tax=Rodentolepis nana TaxID=102285 RepID=A0A0R3TGG1_RODNA|nr:unnamed protein product [Rodentolepis nana]
MEKHPVLGTPINPPFPEDCETIMFGMGCFWGAERRFWTIPNIYSTQVGYAGGNTTNPSYNDVCSGATGHAEVVRVVFNPRLTPLSTLLKTFWEAHDPTTPNRQGNDVGSQYRSAIFVSTEDQLKAAIESRDIYQKALGDSDPITTEIKILTEFFYAEPYHQQYLSKNPRGYCGLKGTGVSFPLK